MKIFLIRVQVLQTTFDSRKTVSYVASPTIRADFLKSPRLEPSSVLASRIIRAHDNPSPPPRARHLPSFAPSPLKDALYPVIDYSESPDVDIPNADIGLQYSTMFDRPAPPSPSSNGTPQLPSLTLREASLSPPPSVPTANTQQHDLISFESFGSPSGSPQQSTTITTAAPLTGPFTTTLQSSVGATVDDLLLRTPTASPSPRLPATPIAFQGDLMIDALRPRSMSPLRRSPRLSPAYEPIPSDGHAEPHERPPRLEASPAPSPALHIMSLPPSEEPEPRATRRSPRHSSTPQALESSPATPEPTLPSEAQTFSYQPQFETSLVAAVLHQFSEPQVRKRRWKGKTKASSPGDEVVDDSQQGVSDGSAKAGEAEIVVDIRGVEKEEPMQEGRGESRIQRDSGSLTPRSATVLEQLYPSIQTTSATDPYPVEDEQSTEQEPAPRDSNTSIFSNPLLASVKRPPPGTPIRFTSPTRGASSPVRLMTGLPLDDLTRTPARRVPIRQAIAQGATPLAAQQRPSHLAPHESAFAASLRTPVFTRPALALDDPQRSPARRVPIVEAMSSTASSVQTALTRYVPPSPVVRGVSRERSASAEPRPRTEKEESASAEPPQQRPMKLPTPSSRPASKLPFPLIAHERPTSIPEESEILSSPSRTEAAPESTSVPAVSTSTCPTKSSLKQPSGSKIPRIGAKPYARPKTSVKEKESKSLVMSSKADADDSVAFSGIVRI